MSAALFEEGSIHASLPRPTVYGRHTLNLPPRSPGLVFDEIVNDLEGSQATHPRPPETGTVRLPLIAKKLPNTR